MIPELLFILLSGLVCGSFVSCASWRLPRGESFVSKPSYCPKCQTKLGFFDLWPVLSWVMSGAKCRHCKAPVSARYPLTELATAAVFVWLYFQFGMTWHWAILAFMWVVLMVMIVVDFEHYIIPDEVHYVLLPLAFVWHYMQGTPFDEVLSGLLLGAGLGLSLHYGYRILRKKEGLGFGDVKFFAVAGTWLGLHAFIPFIFFSGLFGVILGLIWRAMGKGPIFPFGPALAVALFLCVASDKFNNSFYYIEHFIK